MLREILKWIMPELRSSIFGIDDLLIGGGVAALGGLLGKKGGSSQSGTQTITNHTEIDPAMRALLYGSGNRTLRPGVTPIYGGGGEHQGGLLNPDSDYTTDAGLLGKIMGQVYKPQNAGLAHVGQLADNYMGGTAGVDINNMRNAAYGLMGGHLTPNMQAASVNAPSQNNLNLSPAFNDMVYGQAGANPYLTGAIQKGINQSTNAFGNYLTDATKSTQDLLGNIRSGSIANGQFGGNRQGLAEGKALDSFNTNIGRAMSQFGQNNTDAAVSAQAGAYDADRNRALSAMQGLSGQQYGTALTNAQLAQQAAEANQRAQLATNQQNDASKVAGIGAQQGLLGQVYNFATNNDAYDLNRTGQVTGMVAPFSGLGQSSTSSQPLYTNNTANVLGGMTAGLGLFNAFNKLF